MFFHLQRVKIIKLKNYNFSTRENNDANNNETKGWAEVYKLKFLNCKIVIKT